MANVTPAIIDYGKRILDAGFADKSFIEQWFVNTEKYIKLDFQEAGAIRIMQIALDGLSDYSPSTSTASTSITPSNRSIAVAATCAVSRYA